MTRKIKYLISVLTAFLLVFVSCGTESVPEVEISDLNAYQSETNADMGCLSFGFETENGTCSALVTGIRNIDAMTEDERSAMAQKIGGSFAGGVTAHIESPENCQLVDAEKYAGKDNDSVESGKPYGDANLCWAASVADMLVYTGWSDDDEDAVMSEFTENYFDDGSFQETGIKFWFNGVNPDQVCAEEAGSDGCRNAVFKANESNDGDFFASTQVRDPGTENGKIVNRGHVNTVAAETVYEKMYASDVPEGEMAKIIMDAVDAGDAVGLQLLFYNGESRVGVHAITVFGYVKDPDGGLKGLIISDSDNDVDWGREYANSAEETAADRSACPNSYDMYPTGSFGHNETEYISLEGYEYSNSKLKYTDSVIHGVTILKARSSVKEKKDAGTCDAVNTPDIAAGSAIFSGEQVSFDVSAGEKIKIPFIVFNKSYCGYSTKDKPVAKCRFLIYKDGKKVDEASFDAALVTDDYATGEANCGFSVTNTYKFKDAGEYRVDVEITGVYSGKDDHKLAEAFIGNNYVKGAATVTVK